MKFMKKPEKGISVWPILLLLAVLGLLAILARFSYTDYVRPASDKMLVEVNQTDHTDNADPFTKETVWRQTFIPDSDILTGFDFYVTTFQRKNDSTIRVSFGESNAKTPLQTWDILSTGVPDRKFLDFYSDEPRHRRLRQMNTT